MMDEVLVRFGDSAKDTATLLLGAADELDYEPYVVRHQPEDNGFRVPPDVAEKAGLETVEEEAEAQLAEEQRRKQIDVINAERGVDGDGQAVDIEKTPRPEVKKAAAAGEKSPTPKQRLVEAAKELGLSTKGTKAEIDKRIAAAKKK